MFKSLYKIIFLGLIFIWHSQAAIAKTPNINVVLESGLILALSGDAGMVINERRLPGLVNAPTNPAVTGAEVDYASSHLFVYHRPAHEAQDIHAFDFISLKPILHIRNNAIATLPVEVLGPLVVRHGLGEYVGPENGEYLSYSLELYDRKTLSLVKLMEEPLDQWQASTQFRCYSRDQKAFWGEYALSMLDEKTLGVRSLADESNKAERHRLVGAGAVAGCWPDQRILLFFPPSKDNKMDGKISRYDPKTKKLDVINIPLRTDYLTAGCEASGSKGQYAFCWYGDHLDVYDFDLGQSLGRFNLPNNMPPYTSLWLVGKSRSRDRWFFTHGRAASLEGTAAERLFILDLKGRPEFREFHISSPKKSSIGGIRGVFQLD